MCMFPGPAKAGRYERRRRTLTGGLKASGYHS
jgi:hypothetical protein